MKSSEERVYEAVRRGLIEIDDDGCVWKIARQVPRRWGYATTIETCERKRAEREREYLVVIISLDGVRLCAFAHRLVWLHFRGPIPNGLTINHKDGKKYNNNPANLELATSSQQTRHAISVLGFKPWLNMQGKNSQPGARNAMAKLSDDAVDEIRKSTLSGVELAKKYGVRTSTISRVKSGKLWGHI